jgi:hypothetical protein
MAYDGRRSAFTCSAAGIAGSRRASPAGPERQTAIAAASTNKAGAIRRDRAISFCSLCRAAVLDSRAPPATTRTVCRRSVGHPA